MSLNISEGQFVIPQSNVGHELMALSQTMYQRNMANQRLDLAREQKRQEAGNFIEKATDPEHFGTGTVYDPVINQTLNGIRQQAVDLAQKGADIPTIMQQIGPGMNKVNQYYTAAKTVNKQIDDQVKAMHENKMDLGYKLADAKAGALKSALMQQDKDGNWVLQDPANINLSKNYLSQEITDHPELYTTNEALEDYAKNSPKSTRMDAVTNVDKNLRTNKTSVKVTGANWETPEQDADGKIQMVPKYDHATDGGQVLTHTVDGKEEPIRLMDEGAFDQMMANKPGAADFIKGQVRIHAGEYKDANGKPLDMSSPQAKLIARGIAYKELANAGNSTVSTIEQAGKPTGAEINLHYYGNDEDRSYNREIGKGYADWQLQQEGKKVPKGAEKENTIQSLIKVYNNDPSYMDGPTAKVDGVPVVDITGKLPKAEIRWGHGEKDAYSHAYWDPAGRQLIMQKKDNVTYEKIPEGQAGQFFGRIAEANGVPIAAIKPALQSGGWTGGRFTSAGAAPDVAGRANSEASAARSAKVSKGLEKLDTDETNGPTELKGVDVPGGKIDKIDIRGNFRTTFGADKYSMDIKGADGKITTQTFKDKSALHQFLSSKAEAPAANGGASGVHWQ